MLEIILDTETTGLSITEKHRIVEIGCVELENQIPTNKIFHKYINPQRSVSEDAYKVHGYSDKFLADKETFSETKFLSFDKDFTNTHLIGNVMYTEYIHLFQISGIILLLAMIGFF